MLAVSTAVALLYVLILKQTSFQIPILIVMVFVLFILLSFSTLQVTIDEKFLKIKFSYGLFKKKFPLKEIDSVKSVKNHWYYGWGIRFWFYPKTWIFNVSGFDAVEIKMKNSNTYRIGTDEPKKLEKAIKKSL